MDKKIKIYCGENECGNLKTNQQKGNIFEFHPVYQFERARKIIKDFNNIHQERLIYSSNSPDFVSSLYYMAEQKNIPVELYLNGELSTLENIFEDWNRSYYLLDKELGWE